MFNGLRSSSLEADKNIQAFFTLLRAGLWEDVDCTDFGAQGFTEPIDWEEVYRLAEEQSVVGLVLAGIEHSYVKPPQELLLQWIGEVQIIEQQNKSLNDYLAKLIELLRNKDVYAILIKGQGVAQCYDKPLWRSSGDIDLLLSEGEYEKAKALLLPLTIDVEKEYKSFKHQGMTMEGGHVVELHGTVHSRLSKRIDKGVDEAQNDVFYGGNVRSWHNGRTPVFLPGVDSDVIFVFTHILHHFYIEGIGLRQICDWCRLLWTYRSKLDLQLLESRIRKMELMSEWKVFYNLANRCLGMPDYGSGLMVHDSRYDKKADRVMEFVLESGNFGHNREKTHGKIQSAWSKTKDFARHSRVFPLDSIKFFWHFLWNGVELAIIK